MSPITVLLGSDNIDKLIILLIISNDIDTIKINDSN